MTVMVPREKWTDERLDDLNGMVDQGFAETKSEMREGFADTKAEMREVVSGTKAELREEIADTKAEMREGFARVDAEIRGLRGEMNVRFDAMNRNFIAGLITVIATVIGSHAL